MVSIIKRKNQIPETPDGQKCSSSLLCMCGFFFPMVLINAYFSYVILSLLLKKRQEMLMLSFSHEIRLFI